MSFSLKNSGSTKKMEDFLKEMQSGSIFDILARYGRVGVDALSSATPVDTGETAASWYFEITHENGNHILAWFNDHIEEGVNVAIILQYGHGTGTGGWVEGRDYINPEMQPLFDTIAEDIVREVRNA